MLCNPVCLRLLDYKYLCINLEDIFTMLTNRSVFFIRTANLLTKLLVQNGGTLDSLDDRIIFLMVRNNVHGDSLIFGSAIGFEKYVYR